MSVFSPQLREKIEHFLKRYETKRSGILPILHEIQDECGWIKEEHVRALETEFGLPQVQVQEVATFYSMYRLKEPSKFQVLFCDNIVCTIMGAKETMAEIHKVMGEYTEKGKACPFSLEGVPCLGVCDGAPAMLVNKERHLLVSPDKVRQVLAQYDVLPQ